MFTPQNIKQFYQIASLLEKLKLGTFRNVEQVIQALPNFSTSLMKLRETLSQLAPLRLMTKSSTENKE